MRRQTQLLIAAVFQIACVVGCAPDVRLTYRFKVVDGDSGIPLSGVVVDGDGYGHYHDNRAFPGKETTPMATTQADGVAVIPNVVSEWHYDFVFKKAGFRTLLVQGGSGYPDWNFHYKVEETLPSDDFKELDGTLIDGVENKIVMYRMPH